MSMRIMVAVSALTWASPPAAASSSDGDPVVGLVVLVLLFLAYMLPTIVALGRSHPSTMAITLLTLFLGWTLLGWVAALVWAVAAFAPPPLPAAPSDGGKRCPQCAEVVQTAALVCRYCGHRFG